MSVTRADVKACCVAAYDSAAARYLLGDSLHPGGAALTARLVRALGVGPRAIVVDIASGPGTSAQMAARLVGCRVIGLDLSHDSTRVAAANAADADPGGRIRFVTADAEALPLRDASVDGILCECALCLFPAKKRAIREIARVLRRGARLALSDVTAASGRLPVELRTLEAHVACLAGALPLIQIASLVSGAGLIVETLERHDDALGGMLERIEARLRVARLVGGGPLSDHITSAQALLASAREAVSEGTLGYGVVIARR